MSLSKSGVFNEARGKKIMPWMRGSRNTRVTYAPANQSDYDVHQPIMHKAPANRDLPRAEFSRANLDWFISLFVATLIGSVVLL